MLPYWHKQCGPLQYCLNDRLYESRDGRTAETLYHRRRVCKKTGLSLMVVRVVAVDIEGRSKLWNFLERKSDTA